MFYELDYLNSGLKHHIVEGVIKEKSLLSTEEKRQAKPREIKIATESTLDPGGMISIKTNSKVLELENFSVKVKPEHIIMTSYLWNKTLKKVEVDGTILYKVYLDFYVWVVTEDTYNRIQKWLTALYTEGLLAQEEILESLQGCENIILPQRKSVGDA